jgi:pimeloyl-ACP methyl ester carboxylesterase
MTTRSVRNTTTRNGSALSWVVDGEGPPVVMIHGMGIGADGWAPQTEALSSEFACMRFDNRGFGESQPAGDPLSIDLMADDVLALMDAISWEQAHVVSHSIGGLVALVLAQRARHRIRSLALLCTFSSGRVPTRMSPRLLALGMRTRIGSRRMRRNAFLEMVMPRVVLENEDLDALALRLSYIFSHDLADQPPIVMKQFAATRRCDATPGLAALAGIPTLVVSAQHDPIAPPEYGSQLASRIPGARYVEVSDASHGVTIQRADEVNALLFEHLRNAERRAASATSAQ